MIDTGEAWKLAHLRICFEEIAGGLQIIESVKGIFLDFEIRHRIQRFVASRDFFLNPRQFCSNIAFQVPFLTLYGIILKQTQSMLYINDRL